MKKNLLLTLLITLVLLFTSCGNAELITSLEAEVSSLNNEVGDLNKSVEDLNSQIEVYEAMPTITPVPTPSPTPEPTPEPTPTPMPDEHLSNIISLFESSSLPVEKVIYFNEESDPNNQLGRPNSYIGKASFDHPKSDEDQSCTIEIFANEKDLNDREAYILGVYDSYPLLRQYMYKEGLALIRLSFDILPSQAKEYEDIFRAYWE